MFLAIDTATDHIGICLDDGQRVLAERIWPTRRHHTAELAPEVALMLRDCGVTPDNLEMIAVASGPGSYTGLRIGMGFAKGLALAHNIPMIGVPTLDILAEAQIPAEKPLGAVLKAGRNRLAAVWYKWGRQGWRPQSEPVSLSLDQLLERIKTPSILCGEVEGHRDRLLQIKELTVLPPAACVRRPSYLAQLGRLRIEQDGQDDPAALAPTYLGELEGAEK